jgi:hypothetical protein
MAAARSRHWLPSPPDRRRVHGRTWPVLQCPPYRYADARVRCRHRAWLSKRPLHKSTSRVVHAIGTLATVRPYVTWRRSQSSPKGCSRRENGQHRHALSSHKFWPCRSLQELRTWRLPITPTLSARALARATPQAGRGSTPPMRQQFNLNSPSCSEKEEPPAVACRGCLLEQLDDEIRSCAERGTER